MENEYLDPAGLSGRPGPLPLPPGSPPMTAPPVPTEASPNATDYDLSMSNVHRTVLTKSRIKIIEDLDVTDVMSYLIQEGILNLSMRDEIVAQDTRENRVKKFLDILPRRGANAFLAFVAALERDYSFMAESLRVSAKSLEDFPYHEALHRRGCDIVRTAKIPTNKKENDYEWIFGEDEYLVASELSGYEAVPGLGTGRKDLSHRKQNETGIELVTYVVLRSCVAREITNREERARSLRPSRTGIDASRTNKALSSSTEHRNSRRRHLSKPESSQVPPPGRQYHLQRHDTKRDNIMEDGDGDTVLTHAMLDSLKLDQNANREEVHRNQCNKRPEETCAIDATFDVNSDPALYLTQTLCTLSTKLLNMFLGNERVAQVLGSVFKENTGIRSEDAETTDGELVQGSDLPSDGTAVTDHGTSTAATVDSEATELKARFSSGDCVFETQLPTTEPPSVSSSIDTNASGADSSVACESQTQVATDAGEEMFETGTNFCSAAEATDDGIDSEDDDAIVKLSQGDIVFMYPDSRTEDSTIVHDMYGRCLVVWSDSIGIYGDPTTKPWFYPLPINSVQATMLLSSVNIPGCFLVYIPPILNDDQQYNLSVCSEGGKVSHYHVHRDSCGELSIKCSNVTFPTITNLVDYYQGNREVLCCRLRCPPSEIDMMMKHGGQYEEDRWRLDYQQLKLASDSGSTSGLLGEGRFAQVILANYKNSEVAVKVPDSTQHDGPWFLSDFLGEAKILSSLSHPNIVKLVGFSMHPDPFLVTEVVPLGDLKCFLKKRRQQRDSAASQERHLQSSFEMCCQLTTALKYLKSKTYIIHRDIAARNVLLGENNRIKLCDFGMARLVVDNKYRADANERVAVRWAAPEVMTSLMYSTASDIWAVGVVFWEIFADGAIPYGGYSNIEVTKLVVGSDKLRCPPKCPADLYQTLLSCWHFNPEMRPTPDALSEMLQHKSYYRCLDNPHVEADNLSLSSYESLSADDPEEPRDKKSSKQDRDQKEKKKNILKRLFTSDSIRRKAGK